MRTLLLAGMFGFFIVMAILILVAMWFLVTYNGLVRLRNAVREAWAQIEVQLKRRHDLIPNLMETVKGYMKHERETLEAVTQARAAAIQAGGGPQERQQAENMLSGALKSLFAVAEAYPDLKASTNFLQLQEELSGTEGKIAYARQYYNDVVATYNALRQSFPASLVANTSGFGPEEYFEIETPSEREVPRVQF